MKQKITKSMHMIGIPFLLWAFSCGLIGSLSVVLQLGDGIFSLSMVIITAIFIWLSGKTIKFLKSHRKFWTKKNTTLAMVIMLAIFTIGQIAYCWYVQYVPINDARRVIHGAENFAVTGDFSRLYRGFDRPFYFDEYPNNWGILVILSFYLRGIYLVFGQTSRTAVFILNILANDASFVLTYLLAKSVFKSRFKAVITAFAFIINPVFWLYAPIFYTDTFSAPFVLGAILLFIKAIKEQSLKKSILYFLPCTFVLFIGFSIKGNLCVLIIAFLLYTIFKTNIKKTICIISCIGLLFGMNTAFKAGCINMGISSYQRLYEHQVPTIHWISMSLHGKGGYNQADFKATDKAGNIDQKKQHCKQLLKQRLADYGFWGLLKHQSLKAGYTWFDGQHQAIYQYKDTLKGGFVKSSVLIAWCFLMNISLLAGVFLAFIRNKTRLVSLTLLKLAVLGMALFLCIWETRSRYLYNFLPIMLVLQTEGFINFKKYK